MLDWILAYVRIVVDTFDEKEKAEERQELIVHVWVRPCGAREVIIDQICRECKKHGWIPYQPERWPIELVEIMNGIRVFKTNGGRLMEVPLPPV